MIRRSYRHRAGGVFTPRDYSVLKDHAGFKEICDTILEKLTSSEFRDGVRLLKKVLDNKASEDEIIMACSLIPRIGIFGRTLLNQSNHLKELEARLPGKKTAGLRRKYMKGINIK